MNNNYRVEGDVTYIECHSKGNVIEVKISTSDLERAKEYPLKWCIKDSGGGHLYCFGVYKKKVYYLHRWLLNPSNGMVVDHINNDGLDNRRENIREVSPSVNSLNNSMKGVGFRKDINKWRARVCIEGTEHFIGHFESKKEAIREREAFLRRREIIKESKGVERYVKRYYEDCTYREAT